MRALCDFSAFVPAVRFEGQTSCDFFAFVPAGGKSMFLSSAARSFPLRLRRSKRCRFRNLRTTSCRFACRGGQVRAAEAKKRLFVGRPVQKRKNHTRFGLCRCAPVQNRKNHTAKRGLGLVSLRKRTVGPALRPGSERIAFGRPVRGGDFFSSAAWRAWATALWPRRARGGRPPPARAWPCGLALRAWRRCGGPVAWPGAKARV